MSGNMTNFILITCHEKGLDQGTFC